MSPEDATDWAITLLVAQRDIGVYTRAVEQIAEDSAQIARDGYECDEPHLDHALHAARAIRVVSDLAPGACVTREEVSEYVTLLRNGAGTVVGACVTGSPGVETEG
jgi:hypothetical protein